MRLALAILVVTTVLSLSGCSVLSEILIRSISNSVATKRGTSREPGISASERQRRSEAERLAEFMKSEDRRRMEEQETLRQNMVKTDMRWFRFHQDTETRRPLYDPAQ